MLKKFLKSKPKPPADPYPLLIFERKQHATTSIPGYSLFSRTSRDSLDWLTDCKRGTGRGGLTTTLGAMNDYLIRQDIGFLVTDQGVQEGVTPELPFHDGREFLLQPMIDIAESMASGFGVEQMASGLRVEHLAGGTELIPGRGIRASVAATYLPTSETGQWAAKMFYRRNELLAELPLEKSSVVLLASSCEDWNDQIRTSIMSEIEPYCDPNLWSQMDPHEFQAFSLALHPFPQQPAVLKKLVPKQKIDLSHPLHLQVKVKDANLAYQVCRSVLLNSREMLEKQSTIQMRMGETQLGTRDVFEFDLLDLNRTFSLNLPHEYNFHLTLSVLDQETLLIQGGGMPRLKQILAMLAGKNRLVEDPRIRESAAFAGNGQQMLLVDIHALATSLASLYTAPDQQEEEMDEMIANIIDPFQQANPLCLGTLWESDHMEARFGVPLNLLPAIGEHWDYVQRGVNWLFE